MKRLLFLFMAVVMHFQAMKAMSLSLPHPPPAVSTIKEIAVVYNQNSEDSFTRLTPEERTFIYYIFRAALAGNSIAKDQSHRNAPQITSLLEGILHRKDELLKQDVSFDAGAFLSDIETYLTYLWTNHSQYFVREHSDEKRTPERLNLKLLTEKNLVQALDSLGYHDAEMVVNGIAKSLFDCSYEPTLTVPDSIEKSAVNFYAPDFTDEDFLHLDSKAQSLLNAYFYIDERSGKRAPAYQRYSTKEKYAQELTVIVHWLERAHELASNYPQQFDEHLVKSLEYLINYFKTGDEEFFKKHSLEWLKSHSRVDYTFGFIEKYSDPKSYRAIFQADITIKSLDINKLNAILPDIEKRLPINKKFMRQSLERGGMPNASINVKAFTAGSLGPANLILAYCLPNYEELRAQEGSKQIIYYAEKTVGELINPKLEHRLFNGTEYYEWFEKYDPDYQFMRDIFMLKVILHETVGHGSGKLTTHTFQEGESLTIEGKTYAVGDTIPVTSSNLSQFLAGYGQTIEELRAEIIALLAIVECYDELATIGMFKEWPKHISKDKIIDLSIIRMARRGLDRLAQQAGNAQHITGDHARANTTILYYLIDKGAIELRTEQVKIKDAEYSVLDAYIVDREKAFETIKELANMVQEITSTGNGLKAEWLIKKYGININFDYMHIMKNNMKAAAGDIKLSATLYPIYIPYKNSNGDIVDIRTVWPKNLSQAYQLYSKLALSTGDEYLAQEKWSEVDHCPNKN